MPNWCNNDLIIQPVNDSPEAVKQFEEFLITLEVCEESQTFLDYLRPPPSDLKDYSALHEWYMVNWGCKWDVLISVVKEVEPLVHVYFDSPNTPPVAFMTWLSEKCPLLFFELHYYECGNGFIGLASAEAGDCIDDCRPMTEDDLKGILGDEYVADEYVDEEDADPVDDDFSLLIFGDEDGF